MWTTNVALHNYYEKRGFRFCRIAEVKEIPNRNGRNGGPDRWPSAALFQKPTDDVDATATQRFEEVGPAGAKQAASRAAGEQPRLTGPSIETAKPGVESAGPSIETAKPGIQPASPGIQPPGKDARAITTSVREAANSSQATTADVEPAVSGSRSAVLSTTGGIGSSF